ncbi:hypothetical protein VHUM_03845 [Vanrija humicola]|uniref:Threonyl/alanyl tRNA synthetase SAD domain-containing protein n=1 Tax=Vanrija humicola TaxID=5417 RepID=A0A7D8Z657_VANHU|nr:hypothetical protein VHUM_03845 [Vanrija humicola]
MTYDLPPALPPTATPADYSRIHFDPAAVPAKRIVGLLACQRDPLLRSLNSRVVAARPASDAPLAQKGRDRKKKGSEASSAATSAAPSGAATPTGKLWEVELEDTVIFPEGGGQPWDTGVLRVRDANGSEHAFAVEACVRRGLDAVHRVRVPEGSSVDFATLEGADAVAEVHWDRRRDHMVTHTAQHLLSAVLDAKGLPTLSWGMGQFPSIDAPYVELPRGLTWAEAQAAEEECNAHIREGLKVWIDVTMQGDNGEVRDDERAGDVEREFRGIPKDYTGGVIRHCNITGVDRNACCGTQCPDLSHVGFLHVLPPGTPHLSDTPSSTTPTRLYFVAGPRAIAHLQHASRELSRAGQAVNVGRNDLHERVAKIEANRFEQAEGAKAMKGELARLVADAAAGTPGSVVALHRAEKATHDFDFLSAVAGAWCDARSADTIVLTSAVPAAPPALLLVQSKDHDRAKAVFDAVKAALAGSDKARVKGGGARGRYMAKVDGKWGKGEAEALERVLAELRA